MNLEILMLSETSQIRKNHMLYDSIYMFKRGKSI